MNSTNVLTKNEEYLLESLDEEMLLFNPTASKAMYLNLTSAMVWELIDGTRDVKEIVRLFAEAFPDNSNLESEINTVLDEMLKNGAIEIIDTTSQAPSTERRSLLQVLAAGSASATAQISSRIWIAPAIGTVVVPAHAMTSAPLTTEEEED